MQDLDVLWDIAEDSSEITEGGNIDDVSILDGIDFSKPETADAALTSEESTTEDVTDTTEVETKSDSDTTAPTVEGEEAGNEEKWTEDDLDKFINDLIASQAETEDKVQEIAEVASESNDPQLIKLVDELQTMIAEKNIEIEELKKTNEVTLNKYLNKYWEDSDLSLYKQEVDTLDSNPKLRALIKFRWSDNDKVKTKVDNIVMDLIYDRLWVDVSELLEQKDKAATSSVLGTPESDAPLMPEIKEPEDKDMTYEESINNLF